VIFKVATESTESFEPVGLHQKVLEEDHDYILIDSSSQVMRRSEKANSNLLAAILKPRIDRDPLFAGRNLDLHRILGPTPYSNNDLAVQLRAKEKHTEAIYHGDAVFCAIYSSNIREMISLFAEMVALEDQDSLTGDNHHAGLVRPELQNKILREAGGKFLSFCQPPQIPARSSSRLQRAINPLVITWPGLLTRFRLWRAMS